MCRTLTVLFRRDASRDRQRGRIRYLGFRSYWLDGRPVTVGLDAFCQHGQRFLGLNRLLARHSECTLRTFLYPVADPEAPIHRVTGHRVRRFFLERQGEIGRIHFMDGTPTDVVFHRRDDEAKVLHWIGLAYLEDGERQWFDLTSRSLEEVNDNSTGSPLPRRRNREEMKEAELAETAAT